MSNNPLRIDQINRMMRSDPAFYYAMQRRADRLLHAELTNRIKSDSFIVAQVYGQQGSGKSEVAQTLALEIVKLHRNEGNEVHITFTRNYPETIKKISSMNSTGDILVVIQDEDEQITGQDKYAMRDHFLNFVRTGRKLHHCVIICDVVRDDEMLPFISFSLQTLVSKKYRSNTCMLVNTDGKYVGLVDIAYHHYEFLRRNYLEEKSKRLHELMEAGGGRSVNTEKDQNWIDKVYNETVKRMGDGKLSRDDFEFTLRTIPEIASLTIMTQQYIIKQAYHKWRRQYVPSRKLENQNSSAPAIPEYQRSSEDPFEDEFNNHIADKYFDDSQFLWTSRGKKDTSVPDFVGIKNNRPSSLNVKEYALIPYYSLERYKYKSEVQWIKMMWANGYDDAQGFVYVRDSKTGRIFEFSIEADNDHQKMVCNFNKT